MASHADPDIIASLDRWMTATTAPLYISKIWERFAPHFCKPGKTVQRVMGIPDAGMRIPIGDSVLEAFHRRYMVSNKILRLWARMVKKLDIEMIVPQHGRPLVGSAVGEFIEWVQDLECGVDLMTQENYTIP